MKHDSQDTDDALAPPAPGIPEPPETERVRKIDLDCHIPILDGLRGVAIAIVLVFHSQIYHNPDFFLDRWLRNFSLLGYTGVDLFFVLSGFLITGILYRAKGGPNYFKAFYMRRVLRIFPLYYGIITLWFVSLFILQNHPGLMDKILSGGPKDVIRLTPYYYLYGANFLTSYYHGFFGPCRGVDWSLAIEEHFYMFWPLLVFLLSRRRMMVACAILLGLSAVFRVSTYALGWGEHVRYVLTISRFDGLALGSFLAVALRGARSHDFVMRIYRPVMWVSLVGLILVIASVNILSTDPAEAMAKRFYWSNPLFQTIGYTLTALFFAGFFVTVLHSTKRNLWSKLLDNALMKSLGKYSYAMYLFHTWVIAGLYFILPRADAPIVTQFKFQYPFQVVFTLLAFVITYLLALASWYGYELHFLKLKKFFNYGREKKPAASKS